MRNIKGYKFPDLDEVGNELRDMGCQVDEAAPNFMEVPHFKKNDAANDAKIVAADRHNEDEWGKVFRAEDRHRERLRDGKELAIELVSYHGVGATQALPCGYWSESAEIGLESRQRFHEANYDAAHRNVCDWFVGDISCYSGLTPRAIDELENFARATCVKAPRIDCPLHAGWESDIAMGTSIDATRVCYANDTAKASRDLRNFLQVQVESGLNSRAKGYAALEQALTEFALRSNSYYSDRGYAKDVPPEHKRKGYQGANVPGPGQQ